MDGRRFGPSSFRTLRSKHKHGDKMMMMNNPVEERGRDGIETENYFFIRGDDVEDRQQLPFLGGFGGFRPSSTA